MIGQLDGIAKDLTERLIGWRTMPQRVEYALRNGAHIEHNVTVHCDQSPNDLFIRWTLRPPIPRCPQISPAVRRRGLCVTWRLTIKPITKHKEIQNGNMKNNVPSITLQWVPSEVVCMLDLTSTLLMQMLYRPSRPFVIFDPLYLIIHVDS